MITTEPGRAKSETLENNWALVREITTNMAVMKGQSSRDSMTAHEESVSYVQLLNDLRHDRNIGGVTYLGMYRAPGSKNRHHNVEGGLVRHLLQMWELWVDLRGVFRAHNAQHALLNDSNIWKCILHHDLNKVWKYKLIEIPDTEEHLTAKKILDSISPAQHEVEWANATLAKKAPPTWAVDYADDQIHSFLGDDTNKTIFFLNQRGIKLSLPLYNALITAEGGYSRQPRPKTESVLAKVAYLLDDMSANVIDRLQTDRFWDSKEGGISEVP